MAVNMSSFSAYEEVDLYFLKDHPLGVNILPSTTVYFDEYIYKVEVPGGKIYNDIFLHTEIDEQTRYKYARSTFSTKSRYIYFRYFSELKDFVDEFFFDVNKVWGPIDEDHWNMLSGKLHDKLSVPEVRERYYWNKYDTKIEFGFWRDKYTDKANSIKGIVELVDKNCSNRKWANLPQADKHFYSVFLYYTSEDEMLLPLLKLNYSKNIHKIFRVKLVSDILERNNGNMVYEGHNIE